MTTQIYLVECEHNFVPGIVRKAFRSVIDANNFANEQANIILKDNGKPAIPLSATELVRGRKLNQYFADEAYCDIYPLDVE